MADQIHYFSAADSLFLRRRFPSTSIDVIGDADAGSGEDEGKDEDQGKDEGGIG